MKTKFGSSLPQVVCRRADVLFVLLMFVCVQCCVVLRIVCPVVASFSGFSIFIAPSVFSKVYLFETI
jgi:hypothetical protein